MLSSEQLEIITDEIIDDICEKAYHMDEEPALILGYLVTKLETEFLD